MPPRGFQARGPAGPCAASTASASRAFLLATVQADGNFSIVTTKPNASVAPAHDRMPLALVPGESGVWLGPDFGTFADRNGVALAAEAER